jgi:hypothetical protein
LKTQLQDLVEKQERFEKFRRSGKVLQQLQLPPDLFPVGKLSRQARTLDRLGHDIKLRRQRFDLLEELR